MAKASFLQTTILDVRDTYVFVMTKESFCFSSHALISNQFTREWGRTNKRSEAHLFLLARVTEHHHTQDSAIEAAKAPWEVTSAATYKPYMSSTYACMRRGSNEQSRTTSKKVTCATVYEQVKHIRLRV